MTVPVLCMARLKGNGFAIIGRIMRFLVGDFVTEAQPAQETLEKLFQVIHESENDRDNDEAKQGRHYHPTDDHNGHWLPEA